ncbi:hypothetical protein H0H93_015238 [Arthromyces matolae]|nr:hypothetical protein H0H93_015238 [Arthromyces matolae]
MSDLLSISFKDRQLRLDTPEDIQKLFKDVDLARVEELVMSGNTLGSSAGVELGALIKQMPLLRVANLSDIITNRSIEEVPPTISAICDALTQCKQLVEFDFSNNAFGTRVAPILAPFLSQHVSLQVLKLNNNGFSPEAGNVVAQALLELAQLSERLNRPSNLRVLLLRRNLLKDGSASLWGEVLAAHKNLQKVKLANNGFFEPGVIAIARGLKSCQSLRHLSITDCTAHVFDHTSTEDHDRRGWHFVADVIRAAPLLEFLDISDSGPSSEGCGEIINALSDTPHPHLHTLILENIDLATSEYRILNNIFDTHLPALTLLDLAVNEDLDDNEILDELAKRLEDRGGKLLLDDDDSDNTLDVHGDAVDAEKEVRFVAAPSLEDGKNIDHGVRTKSEIDDLADLLSAGLKIEDKKE